MNKPSGLQTPPPPPQPSRRQGPFSGRAAAGGGHSAPPARQVRTYLRSPLPAPLRSLRRALPARPGLKEAARTGRPAPPRLQPLALLGGSFPQRPGPFGGGARAARTQRERGTPDQGIRGCPGMVGHSWRSALSFPKSRWTTGKQDLTGSKAPVRTVHCSASPRPFLTACSRAGVQSHIGTGSQSSKVCSSLTNCFPNPLINCFINSARRSGNCSGSCSRQNRSI